MANLRIIRTLWDLGYCCHLAYFRERLGATPGLPFDERACGKAIRDLRTTKKGFKDLKERFQRGEFDCIEDTEVAERFHAVRAPCRKMAFSTLALDNKDYALHRSFRDLMHTNVTLTKLLINRDSISDKMTLLGIVKSQSVKAWISVTVEMNENDKAQDLKLGDWVRLNNLYPGCIVDIDFDRYTILFTSERHKARSTV